MSDNSNNAYSNPLIERYASSDMSYIFSHNFKFSTWRKLWIALAESEKELGLEITDKQIAEMKANVNNINFDRAREIEAKTRHDVMAHVHTFAEQCPSAKPIIHLGATSAFVGDNTDLVQLKEAAILIMKRLISLIDKMKDFANDNRSLPTLGFTHFQPAQCTTVGKRATLWLYELLMDYESLKFYIDSLAFRGVKGTTGTQASFLELFENDHDKVKQLDKMVTEKLGFTKTLPVTGQTYTRKIDANAASVLSQIAQSLHKMANDIRLLQHLKEVEEPFGKKQIGSSAMAYKRNPMRSERLTALSRYIISLSASPAQTAAEQWFERTLDDSANKRLSIPEAFLATDASLIIALNIVDGLVVYPKVIEKRILEELPFMATENIIMSAVKKGGDRQDLHEKIRVYSMEAGREVKEFGRKNDLLSRILADKETFNLTQQELDDILDINKFIGRAPEQTTDFIKEYVEPVLADGKKYGAATTVSPTV